MLVSVPVDVVTTTGPVVAPAGDDCGHVCVGHDFETGRWHALTVTAVAPFSPGSAKAGFSAAQSAIATLHQGDRPGLRGGVGIRERK